MAPKAVVVQLRPGYAQGTLPDHRKIVAGEQMTLDWEAFKKLSNGSIQNVIEVVSVVSTGSPVYMSDNNNAIVNSQTLLTTATTTPNTANIGGDAFQGSTGYYFSPNLGNTVQGAQKDDRYMYVQNDTVANISIGDVLVWKDETNRIVTNHRPTFSTGSTNVGNFAGVAIAAIATSDYGYIQITGECDAISVSSSITAGQPLQVDYANNGMATFGGTAVAVSNVTATWTETITATGGTYTLTWNGQVTTSLAYNASAATIQAALGTIATAQGWTAPTVTGTGPLTITLVSPGSQANTLTVQTASLTGGTITLSSSTLTQTITENANVTSGTLGLVVGNYVTADIAYDAEAVVVLAALEQVPGFPASVTATGGPLPSTVTLTYPAGTTLFVSAAVDENLLWGGFDEALTYEQGAQVFGTALTASSSSVQGYIRSSKKKLPYSRFRNDN